MISVIICAHDRKSFLMDAILSAVEQTLDREKFEIIIVKNFEDSKIDDYVRNRNIQSILTDKQSLSGKILEGIKSSTGEIISFLDDDDKFYPRKLEIVNNAFKDEDIVYLHNNFQAIDENNKYLNYRENRIDFNMSSISIKKEIIKRNILAQAKYNIDTFMYLFALDSGKKILEIDEILTEYRLHNSITHNYSSLNEFTDFYVRSLNRSLEAYKTVFDQFSSKKIRDLILHETIFLKIRLKIFSKGSVTLKEYFQFIFKQHISGSTLFEYKMLFGSIFLKKFIVYTLFKNELRKINDYKK